MSLLASRRLLSFSGNASAALVGNAVVTRKFPRWMHVNVVDRTRPQRPVRKMDLPQVVSEVLSRGADGEVGATLTVKGWVRSVRRQKRIAFLNIADGSSLDGLQVVVTDPTLVDGIAAGASAAITGTLVASPKAGQPVELDASSIKLIGASDASAYPIQGRPSLASLRETPHLRPRTAVIAAMVRARSALETGVNDCEGGGESFSVTAPAYEQQQCPDGEAQRMFFAKPVHLTVSGQLHAEALACPTFRAENSHSQRHLAEFYMLEAEAAFADMDDAMDIAEECIKSCYYSMMHQCPDDVQLLRDRGSKTSKPSAASTEDAAYATLDESMANDFARMTYTDAIQALQDSGEKFQYSPFYARANGDGKTAATFDLLVPGIGELVGGSAREERLELLQDAVKANKLSDEGELEWYIDLRRYGTAPHAGFGIGFERMFQYFTGIANIRDAIPFPRHAGTCRL
eukprot:gene7586-26805_t